MVPVNVDYVMDRENLNAGNAMVKEDSPQRVAFVMEMAFVPNASEKADTGLDCTTIVAKHVEEPVNVVHVGEKVKKIYGVEIARERVK